MFATKVNKYILFTLTDQFGNSKKEKDKTVYSKFYLYLYLKYPKLKCWFIFCSPSQSGKTEINKQDVMRNAL